MSDSTEDLLWSAFNQELYGEQSGNIPDSQAQTAPEAGCFVVSDTLATTGRPASSKVSTIEVLIASPAPHLPVNAPMPDDQDQDEFQYMEARPAPQPPTVPTVPIATAPLNIPTIRIIPASPNLPASPDHLTHRLRNIEAALQQFLDGETDLTNMAPGIITQPPIIEALRSLVNLLQRHYDRAKDHQADRRFYARQLAYHWQWLADAEQEWSWD
ncbi:MAG: hypothetical protein Q9218_003430 [Villophora microphyllina]